jgi:hypothetical protein
MSTVKRLTTAITKELEVSQTVSATTLSGTMGSALIVQLESFTKNGKDFN